MSVEDFIIYVYCCVEDTCQTIVNQPLRRRGFMPKLSDAEVITMEIVGEFMSKDHDKGIWRYFHNHWHGWFPNLGSRATMPNKALQMGSEKAHTGSHCVANGGTGGLDPLDGFPMLVCKKIWPPLFQGRSRIQLLCGEGWEVLWLWRACTNTFRRNHLWLCLCRSECGRTGCAAGNVRRSARLANRRHRLYSSQPKARTWIARYWFENTFTKKYARLKTKGVCQLTDVKRTLNGNCHWTIDRTVSYWKSEGSRHLAFS